MQNNIIWSPTGPTVAAGTNPGAAFRSPNNIASNLGGVAWVFNDTDLVQRFTIGNASVSNSILVPISARQGMFIAFGATDTHIIATALGVWATPGIAHT
jgi:hypothetical protein